MIAIEPRGDGRLAIQQQLEEYECMLSMFPNENELIVDEAAKVALEEFVLNGDQTATLPRIQYTLYYKDLPFGRETPGLTLICPPSYPEIKPMLFEVKCPQLSRMEMETLNSELQELATAACETQEVVGLQLYQHMHEFLSQVQSVDDERDRDVVGVDPENTSTPMVLGRRAIYFHHIIALTKRRVVKEWALELKLGGFCKIGWPGVIIVEGIEDNVQEYVRRLQHLRWKQMTVRGEQTEQTKDVNLRWLLPQGIQEFPENGMSDLAATCRAVGLEELFLTTMKIYGRTENKGER
ncbi:unnamed protein product [Peronospora belbahrii]|uniref:RWD domain-containing protein n=1 Tax=Peronospora belbahrii TaxID=622444 RepID=A0AAU9KVU3_9STRA|nr:unnamed protein product [Peronospora belbahrii]CAH0517756.1 unnamed protein product [Peronospora belbahrii]